MAAYFNSSSQFCPWTNKMQFISRKSFPLYFSATLHTSQQSFGHRDRIKSELKSPASPKTSVYVVVSISSSSLVVSEAMPNP